MNLQRVVLLGIVLGFSSVAMAVDSGEAIFGKNCKGCHGAPAMHAKLIGKTADHVKATIIGGDIKGGTAKHKNFATFTPEDQKAVADYVAALK